MQHRHYFQSDVYIESESEDVKFKRYIENDNKRFLQFIEGSLEEILPEDFGENVTVIPSGVLYLPDVTSKIKRVVFPDSVITIGTETSNSSTLDFFVDVEIVFPKNLKFINGAILDLLPIKSCNIICDFSKVTQVPTITSTQGVGFKCNIKEIRVPNSLYNTWIAASMWKDLDSTLFVAV